MMYVCVGCHRDTTVEREEYPTSGKLIHHRLYSTENKKVGNKFNGGIKQKCEAHGVEIGGVIFKFCLTPKLKKLGIIFVLAEPISDLPYIEL